MDSVIEHLREMETKDLYASGLEDQAKINRSDTVAFISTLKEFEKATTVLDAGCGPAAFAQEIRHLLGNKSYLGIDIEPSFIRRAEEKFQGAIGIRFTVSDIHQHQGGPYDVILMYAVLQHLPN